MKGGIAAAKDITTSQNVVCREVKCQFAEFTSSSNVSTDNEGNLHSYGVNISGGLGVGQDIITLGQITAQSGNINNNLTVNGGLSVAKNAYIGGNINVEKDLTVGENIINEKGDPFEFKIEGSLKVPINLGYATAASIPTGALVSTAASLAIKDSTGQNMITLSCNETDVNTLLVRGQARFGSIFVNQTSQIGDLAVSKPAIFSSDLNFKGTTNVQDLNVSGDKNVSGSLNVAQQAIIGSLIVNGNTNLALNGNTNFFTLNVTGDSNYQLAQFNDNVVMLKSLELHSSLNILGPLNCPPQPANKVFAADSGNNFQPSFRSLVAAGIPLLPYVSSTTQQPANYVFAGNSQNGQKPLFRSLIMADLLLLSYSMPIFSTSEPLPLVLNAGNAIFTCAYHYINAPVNSVITSISNTFSSILPPHSCYTVNVFTQALLNVAYDNNISAAKSSIPPNQWVRFTYINTVNGVFIGKWSAYAGI